MRKRKRTQSAAAIHHSVKHRAASALIVIDMFSDYDAAEVKPLAQDAHRAAPRIKELKERCKKRGVPTIYVNDNRDAWRSSASELVKRTLASKRGREIAALLAPEPDDYFLLKPKHSIFMATPLEVLLSYMHAETLILTGMAGIQCVLFSAMEAHIRDFKLIVPADCLVSEKARDAEVTEYVLRTRLKADTRRSSSIRIRT